MPLAPRRPPLPPRRPSVGLTPDAESLRQWQAATYQFGALRQHAPTPPKPSLATARDGDLARVDARFRYDQAVRTRQMALEASRQHLDLTRLVNPAPARYTLRQTPNEDYYKPEMVRQRATAYKLAQQKAQLLADHPLEAQVGEGVVIGSNLVTSTMLSEVALLRLASGLRWAGATRAALAVRSTTFAGAGEEVTGLSSSLKQYRRLSLKEGAILTRNRFGLDFAGQGVANYYGSTEKGVSRVLDAGLSVNLVESALAGANVRPIGLGLTSGMFQYSLKSGFRTPLNGSLTWQSFGAQATAAAGMGYVGLGAGNLLNKRLAYSIYHHAVLRLGADASYPVWLGSAHLFRTVVPIGLGGATTAGQNAADATWPTIPSSTAIPVQNP